MHSPISFAAKNNIHLEQIGKQQAQVRSEVKEATIKKEITKEKIERVTGDMNKFLEPSRTHLQFKLHEKSNEYYVELVDDRTQEVIREIPSKKLLDMHAEMITFVGLLVDKKM
ncbi:flagellar protein FlaG [Priestia taiwanensis]|uniref:Flagellar protein FlaG n=1 Tax=Priestia taiwanensis TaxID=1347902 RepID=A0A917AWE8_9BACI|nr:flagellar protein FlaG [Priestia taiwanensis]MBM7364389.1 flagellar protein FlaG [Priestia taiwanensis]GGE81765.1 hypothetical protein GCM10007140_34300 [Priestia taiwanensis]